MNFYVEITDELAEVLLDSILVSYQEGYSTIEEYNCFDPDDKFSKASRNFLRQMKQLKPEIWQKYKELDSWVNL